MSVPATMTMGYCRGLKSSLQYFKAYYFENFRARIIFFFLSSFGEKVMDWYSEPKKN